MKGDDWWCAIADGVGGAEAGEIAARLCIEGLKLGLEKSSSVREIFHFVSEYLSKAVEKSILPPKSGSTLTVLKISGNKAFVGHVGDSRITHYRGAGVLGRTSDQTEVRKLLDEGALTKHQARRYPRRNVLLSYMSPLRTFDLYETQFDIQRSDRILLTTDGFHEKILRQEVSRISLENPDFGEFFDALVDELLKAPLTDDATCVAIEID